VRARDILELAEKPGRNGRCASVGISGSRGLGGNFADVIEGAGNVESRVRYKKESSVRSITTKNFASEQASLRIMEREKNVST
jgi:hypothetical protein